MLSVPHMIVLFVIVLVVFGPQKLPELARNLGKLMAEFRKASSDFKGAFEEEMRTIERQAVLNERKRVEAASAAQEPQPASQGTSATSETPVLGTHVDVDARNTEALTIATVAESVPRSETVLADTKAESQEPSATKTDDSLHDHQQPA